MREIKSLSLDREVVEFLKAYAAAEQKSESEVANSILRRNMPSQNVLDMIQWM